VSAPSLNLFIHTGTGALPRMIRLADGPGYWLSVTSTQAPDGSQPADGQYAWLDVLPSEYVIPPASWAPFADPSGSGDYVQVPSYLVRQLIEEHGGERVPAGDAR
jgi:hypothetical protein